MDSNRRTALVTGALFLVTFVTAIPAAFIYYALVLDDASYVVGGGADAGVALGALLEVLLIIATSVRPSPCSPSSSGRTRGSLSAMSPLGSLNAPSSPSASSACSRS